MLQRPSGVLYLEHRKTFRWLGLWPDPDQCCQSWLGRVHFPRTIARSQPLRHHAQFSTRIWLTHSLAFTTSWYRRTITANSLLCSGKITGQTKIQEQLSNSIDIIRKENDPSCLDTSAGCMTIVFWRHWRLGRSRVIANLKDLLAGGSMTSSSSVERSEKSGIDDQRQNWMAKSSWLAWAAAGFSM